MDAPSLLLTAGDVSAGLGLALLTRRRAPRQAAFLAGLGTAVRLFPDLEDALREPAPAAVTLDNAGALRVPQRDRAAAGWWPASACCFPTWARRARFSDLELTTKSSTASSPSARQSAFGLQDLVEFRYDLAVGDHVLSPGELAELAALKVPLVPHPAANGETGTSGTWKTPR